MANLFLRLTASTLFFPTQSVYLCHITPQRAPCNSPQLRAQHYSEHIVSMNPLQWASYHLWAPTHSQLQQTCSCSPRHLFTPTSAYSLSSKQFVFYPHSEHIVAILLPVSDSPLTPSASTLSSTMSSTMSTITLLVSISSNYSSPIEEPRQSTCLFVPREWQSYAYSAYSE